MSNTLQDKYDRLIIEATKAWGAYWRLMDRKVITGANMQLDKYFYICDEAFQVYTQILPISEKTQ